MENDLYNQEDPLAGIPTDVPNLLDGEPPPDMPETPTETPPATVATEPTPDQVAAYLREHPELLPPPQIIQQPIQAPVQTVNPYEMREDETLEQFQTRTAGSAQEKEDRAPDDQGPKPEQGLPAVSSVKQRAYKHDRGKEKYPGPIIFFFLHFAQGGPGEFPA